MSIELARSIQCPDDRLSAKTYNAERVFLHLVESAPRTMEIDMRDFCELVLYVLTNTDLEPDDPRVPLVNKIKEMEIIEGHNGPNTGRFA